MTSTSVVVTGEVLARPDVKWHVLPAPRIEIQPQGRERLNFRVGRNASLVAVAAELAADDARRGWWTKRLQYPHLLVTQGLVVRAYRWLHGEQGNDLENVVLDDVPDRADFFVEVAPTTYTEALRHGDLHALHVIAIPDRLQEGVGKAKVEHVLHRLFAR